MKRKYRWLLTIAIFAAFAVWLEPTRVVWGWLRGEVFYQGRPTSYWENVLTSWEVETVQVETSECVWVRNMGSCIFSKYENKDIPVYKPSPLQKTWAKCIGETQDSMTPAILLGDPEAKAVLHDLSEAGPEKVRALARYGLAQVR